VIPRRTLTLIATAATTLVAGAAAAQEVRVHAKGVAAHAVSEPQSRELGWGGGGALAAELQLAPRSPVQVGVQVQTTALALSQGAPPSDPTLARRSTGTMFGASGGLRLSVGGLWLDGGGGVALTGAAPRPLIDVALGWDFRIGARSPLQFGPFVGYEQVVQTTDTVRPEDGRVVMFGVHFVLGSRPARMAPPVVQEAKRLPPKPLSPLARPDRDGDKVFDDEDACPDVFGIRTDIPSTNGCPETTVRLVEDHLELPDRIHFEFGSPQVQNQSLALLQKIAEYINARGDVVQIEIRGHADEIGSQAYNLNLSRDRAKEVKRLLADYGVHAELVTRAFGKDRPRATGHSDAARQLNRRVEFFVTLQHAIKDEPLPPAVVDQSEASHASN
jgi:outer membrane protein OmpA-like peptidoglycan-associated protein